MAKGIGRNGELFKQLCDPAHLIRSAVAAARGKRHQGDVSAYLFELEPNCFRLSESLLAGSWMPGPYHTFHIREPKPRMISAAPFPDRVVHHALVAGESSPPAPPPPVKWWDFRGFRGDLTTSRG